MNKDDIINLAREYTVGGLEFDEEGLLCFVEIIAAAEREACAKVCEEKVERPADYQGRFAGYGNFMGDKTGSECASAIRARGQE